MGKINLYYKIRKDVGEKLRNSTIHDLRKVAPENIHFLGVPGTNVLDEKYGANVVVEYRYNKLLENQKRLEDQKGLGNPVHRALISFKDFCGKNGVEQEDFFELITGY